MSLRLLAFFACLCFSAGLQAAEPPARLLAQELLTMTGTAIVFDHTRVQRALADPQPFLGDAGRLRRERLVEEVGLRRWQPPRVWLLQSRREGELELWESVAPLFGASALSRGYTLVDAAPLPAAREAIAFLTPGVVHNSLATLLHAYEADVLVLVRGQDWSLWTQDRALQGKVPTLTSLLPHVLAETLAALQQWPETSARPIVQIEGIDDLADFAGAQAALQALPGLRQAQLIRVAQGGAWFGVIPAVDGDPAAALAGDPRLELAENRLAATPQPAGVVEACRLACVLQRLKWRPEAAVPPPATPLPAAPAGLR